MKLSFCLQLEAVTNSLNMPECMSKELLGFVYINTTSVEIVMSFEPCARSACR